MKWRADAITTLNTGDKLFYQEAPTGKFVRISETSVLLGSHSDSEPGQITSGCFKVDQCHALDPNMNLEDILSKLPLSVDDTFGIIQAEKILQTSLSCYKAHSTFSKRRI